MTRNQWELMYMSTLGDTLFYEGDGIPDERRLERIDQTIVYALEAIEYQVRRIRKLRDVRAEYVPKERPDA